MLLASRDSLLHRCTAPAPPKGGGAGGAECPVLCGAEPVQTANVQKTLRLKASQAFIPGGEGRPGAAWCKAGAARRSCYRCIDSCYEKCPIEGPKLTAKIAATGNNH